MLFIATQIANTLLTMTLTAGYAMDLSGLPLYGLYGLTALKVGLLALSAKQLWDGAKALYSRLDGMLFAGMAA